MVPQKTDVIENNTNKNKTESKPKVTPNDIRGIWYFLGIVLLLLVTVLIFVALFTNNWRKSLQDSQNSNQVYSEYYTFGIWFTCRHITIVWLGITDIYCSQINNDLGGWIVSVQVFYTLGATINLFCLVISIYGIFRDIKTYKKAIPSLLLWILIISTIFQLVAISVFGGYGIGYEIDSNTQFQPDYSLICGSVAVGVNSLCIIFFLVEITINKDIHKLN